MIVIGNCMNFAIAVLICSWVFLDAPAQASTAITPEFFYGDSFDRACEPRLVPTTGGVMSHECDNSVRCLGWLCIGSEHGARNYPALQEAGVTHIISAIGTCKQRTDLWRPCLNLKLEDTVAEVGLINALQNVHMWLDIVQQPVCLDDHCAVSRQQMRVFVHCAAGVSRSASIFIALMLARDSSLSYDTALAALRDVRSVVRPNPLFDTTLRVIAAVGTNREAECAVYFLVTNAGEDDRETCTCKPETCKVVEELERSHEMFQFKRLTAR